MLPAGFSEPSHRRPGSTRMKASSAAAKTAIIVHAVGEPRTIGPQTRARTSPIPAEPIQSARLATEPSRCAFVYQIKPVSGGVRTRRAAGRIVVRPIEQNATRHPACGTRSWVIVWRGGGGGCIGDRGRCVQLCDGLATNRRAIKLPRPSVEPHDRSIPTADTRRADHASGKQKTEAEGAHW